MDKNYKNFITNISKKFNSFFEEISVINNFEYGSEFEIAICKALRAALPSNYGICRGSVFDIDGNSIGDDIVIYDQFHFPTLRLLDDPSFSQKQQIPFEAVIAYIEAKNTIILEGHDNNSLEKAINQAIAIKNLKRSPTSISEYSINGIPLKTPLPAWPQIGNPIFTAIFAKGVRKDKNSAIMDSKDIYPIFLDRLNELCISKKHPDMIIPNEDLLIIPEIDTTIESPYFIENRSKYNIYFREAISFGLALSFMFYAFDNIKLGQIYWPQVIADGLNATIIYKD